MRVVAIILSCWVFLASSVIIQNGETFFNSDFYERPQNYDLHDFLTPIDFSSIEKCSVKIVPPVTSIFIVELGKAIKANCTSFAQIIEDTLNQASPSLMIFTSASPDFGTIQYFSAIRSEPYGDIPNSVGIFLTLVAADTAKQILSVNSPVQVTSQMSKYELWINSPGFAAMNWTFFVAWFIIFIYGIVQLFILFYKSHFSLDFTFRHGIFIIGILLSAMMWIELAVDPDASTGRLGSTGYKVVLFLGYLFAFYLLAIMLLAWIQIAGVDGSILTERTSRWIVYFVRFTVLYITVAMLLLMFIGTLTYAGYVAVIVYFALLLPIFVFQLSLFIYFGIRLLLSLRSGLLEQDYYRRLALKKITALMISCSVSFFFIIGLVSLVIFIAAGTVTGYLNAWQLDVGIRIGTELAFLEMVIVVYFSVTIRNLHDDSYTERETKERKEAKEAREMREMKESKDEDEHEPNDRVSRHTQEYVRKPTAHESLSLKV